MTTLPVSTVRPALRAVAAAALFTVMLSGARADEPNPYYIGASVGYTHDSNIYRTPTSGGANAPEADNIASVGLLAGIDQPFGRQHFYASGDVHHNRFSNHSDLDNTSYGLNTGLDWSTIDRLSGTVKYRTNRNLANYGNGQILDFRGKNVERDQQFDASVRLGLVSLLSLEGKYGHANVDYSAPEFNGNDYRQNVYSLGVIYRPSGILTLGTAFRTTRGEYPNITGDGLTFRRNDADLTAIWEPTGESHFDARISYTRQRYDEAGFADFNGTTGALSWTFRPTGKLTFIADVSHDTGASSNYTFNVPVPGLPIPVFLRETGNTSHVNDQLQLRAQWEMTAKIRAEVRGQYLRRSLEGVEQPGDTGHDSLRTAALQLTWDATRNIELGCSASHESRASDTFAATSYPYKDTTYGCSVQAVLQ